VNANKDSITPSVAMRKKPPVFEIFGVLPKTNCGLCGEKSCMAFAALLQSGTAKPKSCTPIFKGEYTHLQEKYFEMCSNLGLDIFS
jgi:ArsR family metal-binding transcriptional regulator